MAHHRQHGNYNQETSLCVQALNPRCSEDEIIEELNLILRDDRLARQKKIEEDPTIEAGLNHFILSAIVS